MPGAGSVGAGEPARTAIRRGRRESERGWGRGGKEGTKGDRRPDGQPAAGMRVEPLPARSPPLLFNESPPACWCQSYNQNPQA